MIREHQVHNVCHSNQNDHHDYKIGKDHHNHA